MLFLNLNFGLWLFTVYSLPFTVNRKPKTETENRKQKSQTMAKVDRFEDLDVWQLAREICNDLENLFNTTPLGKRYSLLNQMDRSSGSVMDNIAEGFGRGGSLEFRNFLGFSKGSCTELKSQLYRAKDKNLISSETFDLLTGKCDILNAKLGSFINYLSKTEFKGTKFKK